MTNYYRNHTDEELITEGTQLTSTPLERELAERLGKVSDELELYKNEID